MENFNANDISNAISMGMSESHFTKTEKQLLQTELLARSKDVFQWTSLVLDTTIQSQPRGYSLEQTLELVELVPADLHDLYKSLLRLAETPQSPRSEHHLREQQLTLKLFQWVLFAIRPLSHRQLQHALALDWRMEQTSVAEYQNSRDFIREEHLALRIKDLSKGLIHISGPFSSGQVQFIHQSVPDFLLGSTETLQKLRFDSAIPMTWLSHFQLSRSCLKFLLMSEVREAFGEGERSSYGSLDCSSDWEDEISLREEQARYYFSEKLPLIIYAWKNWIFHAENAQRQNFDVPDEFARQDPLYSVSQTNKILQGPSDFHVGDILGDPTKSCYHEFHADSCFPSPFRHSYVGWDLTAEAPSMVHLFAYCGLDGFTRYLGNLHPTSFEEKDRCGNTPLNFAIMGKQKSTVHLLLQSGVDVNPSPRGGVPSPLCLACKWGDMEVISLLIKARANVNFSNQDDTPLSCAAYAGHENVVEFLIESGAKVNQRSENGNTALFAVVSSDESRLDIFTSLLRHGASIESRNILLETPLHYSAANSPTPVFKAFLEEALKFEKKDRSAKRDAWSITSKLSKQSENSLCIINGQDRTGQTPIFWALIHEDWKRLELLYDAGADLKIRDQSGNTPLLEAANSSSHEHIEFLLRASASVDEVNSRGDTALLAYLDRVVGVKMDTLRLFIQYGANLNTTNTKGRSPLMLAASILSVEGAALLLQYGAEVNAQDHDGRTPLLHATRSLHMELWKLLNSAYKCPEMVELLLNSGANVHAVDHSGKNALFYFRTKKSEPVFRLLQEAGLQEVLGHSSESEPGEDDVVPHDDVPPPSPKGKTQRMRKGARKFVASITRRLKLSFVFRKRRISLWCGD